MESVAPITGKLPKKSKVKDVKRLRLKLHRSTFQGLRSLARQNGTSTRRYVRGVLEAHVASNLTSTQSSSGGESLSSPTVPVVETDTVSQSSVPQPIVQA